MVPRIPSVIITSTRGMTNLTIELKLSVHAGLYLGHFRVAQCHVLIGGATVPLGPPCRLKELFFKDVLSPSCIQITPSFIPDRTTLLHLQYVQMPDLSKKIPQRIALTFGCLAKTSPRLGEVPFLP
jgi:hypothetical protein